MSGSSQRPGMVVAIGSRGWFRRKWSMTTDELCTLFDQMEDWDERYDHLIEMGQDLPELPAALKRDEFKVQGCQSQVWLLAKPLRSEPPRVELTADSDSMIVRGIIAILLLCYSGRTPEEILAFDIRGLLQRLGLSKHLSPSRSNGLHSMVKRIRQVAERLLAEQAAPGGTAPEGSVA
jgi:cysteine desulfuration protein SufE